MCCLPRGRSRILRSLVLFIFIFSLFAWILLGTSLIYSPAPTIDPMELLTEQERVSFLNSDAHKRSLVGKPLGIPVDEKLLVGELRALNTQVGLGNQLFEVLAFQGIAKYLQRKPVIIFGEGTTSKYESTVADLKQRFPHMFDNVGIYWSPTFHKNKSISAIDVSQCCCCYVDIDGFKENEDIKKTNVVKLIGLYMQSYRYLRYLDLDEVHTAFSYNDSDREKVDNMQPQLKATHRICIHTRRGDFINFRHQFSTRMFIRAALTNITTTYGNNVSITLFGDDRQFMTEIKDAKMFEKWHGKIFLSDPLYPSNYHLTFLYFASNCDIILQTASTSTFGFWGAYLAGPLASVYYNKPIGRSKTEVYQFPPEWIELDYPNNQDIKS